MNNNILAGYKKLLSYTKSTWHHNDYPLHYKNQGQINQTYDLDLTEIGDGNILRILKYIQAENI